MRDGEFGRQVEELYHELSAKTSAERPGLLAAICEDSVRREVESLLAFDAMPEDGDFIRELVSDLAPRVLGANDAATMAGRVLGHYQILSSSPLGAGGMGEVYAARDMSALDRTVALKLLRPDCTRDRDQVQRVKREAQSISKLNHPNTVTVFEIGEAADVYFIAEEFIEGKTLRERITDGPLPLAEAVDVAVQIARALQVAHGAGFVHRDIKPGNVMLRPDGIVKVLDFGVAKLMDRGIPASDSGETAGSGDQLYTTPGCVIGTLQYMSPEQILGQKVDGRSDLFSLRLVLFELVTGRTPFEASTSMELVAAVLTADAPPLSLYAEQTPPERERIVRNAIAR